MQYFKVMLSRPRLLERIERSLAHFPVLLLLGSRRCGKTTPARQICDRHQGDYFDLEDPETALRPEIAKTVLKDLDGLVVIDEIQRQPGLFALLRVLADRAMPVSWFWAALRNRWPAASRSFQWAGLRSMKSIPAIPTNYGCEAASPWRTGSPHCHSPGSWQQWANTA